MKMCATEDQSIEDISLYNIVDCKTDTKKKEYMQSDDILFDKMHSGNLPIYINLNHLHYKFPEF